MPASVKALIDAPGTTSYAALPASVPNAAPTNSAGVKTPLSNHCPTLPDGQQQGAEAAHANAAEHDFSNEQSTDNGCVIRAREPGYRPDASPNKRSNCTLQP